MNDQKIVLINRIVLAIAALFFVYDLWTDRLEGEPWLHFIPELTVFSLVIFALSYEILSGTRLRSELRQHQQQLSDLQGQFADTVRQEFEKWKLTQSETEIAWLIVKGFSFGEIAYLRKVKEKTVRQQATSIYAKSGAKNRSELTALFFEDLLTASA
ncbi:MAG: helix-turn-helix transcriptional regulator [Woeseiaceae bacterium]|nr:helix-turn-helix transcriptional regulator [Woeseiaceae bacterium]